MSTLINDLVDANHILFHQGIVDAFGHVSVRSESDPARFHLARNLAPAQVTAADIVEYRVDDAEPVAADAPRAYLERFIHSEIYRRRTDVMAVVHSHSAAVLPFCIVTRARLRPVCHMCGFLGDGPPVFEIRDHAGEASDLLIRSRELGAALARALGAHPIGEYVHLMQRVDAKQLDALLTPPVIELPPPGGEPIAPDRKSVV